MWFHFTGFVGSSVPCPSVYLLLLSWEERRQVISKIKTPTKNIPSSGCSEISLVGQIRLARNRKSCSTGCSFGRWWSQVQERKGDVLASKWDHWVCLDVVGSSRSDRSGLCYLPDVWSGECYLVFSEPQFTRLQNVAVVITKWKNVHIPSVRTHLNVQCMSLMMKINITVLPIVLMVVMATTLVMMTSSKERGLWHQHTWVKVSMIVV